MSKTYKYEALTLEECRRVYKRDATQEEADEVNRLCLKEWPKVVSRWHAEEVKKEAIAKDRERYLERLAETERCDSLRRRHVADNLSLWNRSDEGPFR